MSDRLQKLAGVLLAEAPGSPADPEPPAEDLGALDAVAFTFDHGVHVSLYLFDTWDGANAAAKELTDLASTLDDGVRRRASTNGPALFVGSVPTDPDDSRPRFALSKLLAAFAGRE